MAVYHLFQNPPIKKIPPKWKIQKIPKIEKVKSSKTGVFEAPGFPERGENLGNYHKKAHAKYGAFWKQKHHFRGRNTFWKKSNKCGKVKKMKKKWKMQKSNKIQKSVFPKIALNRILTLAIDFLSNRVVDLQNIVHLQSNRFCKQFEHLF